MLNCKLCNYYRSVSNRSFPGLNLSICDLADILFIDDVENIEIEHPCSKINYSDYLRKKASATISSSWVSQFVNPEMFAEMQTCGVSMLRFPEGIIEKCFQNYLADKTSEMHSKIQVD